MGRSYPFLNAPFGKVNRGENMKKKSTDFYLLKKKSLSEGDLFVTDYLQSRREIEKLKKIVDMLSERVSYLESSNTKKIKLIKMEENEK